MKNNTLDSEWESSSTTTEIGLTGKSVKFLNEVAKWGKFLAVVGFVCLGLLAILSLFLLFKALTADFMSSYYMGMAVPYLVMCVLYFFPTYYLFNFSNQMKEALLKKGSLQVEQALSNLKSFFKFIGILTIVIIGIYVLVFLFGIITTIGRGF